MFTAQISQLIACVETGHESILKDVLYILSRFARSVNDESVWSDNIFPLFEKIVLEGSYEESKYATITLLNCPVYSGVRKSALMKKIMKMIKSDDCEDVARAMSAWSQCVKYELDLVQSVDSDNTVNTFITDELLKKNEHCVLDIFK